ncbi:MAG: zinc-ribbon domain-containing protein [Anaerolineales bacterium]|nr:zinc-ribbon domain-containing protein [Anaerolineales bacterium]
MTLGSIFLVLAVILLVGLFIYAPFTAHSRRLHAVETLQVSALKAERDRVINALQELDFDFNLGKIPAEEYPAQRGALLQKGADILRSLDELAPVISSNSDAEARLEKAIVSGRADMAASAPVEVEVSDDDIESMLAARRKERKDKSAGFCPKCGKAALVTDKFCPSCGKSLQ